MYSFFLNSTAIDEPVNFDRLVLRHTRSKLYFGSLLGARSFVLGNRDLIFEQSWVYEQLTQAAIAGHFANPAKFEIFYNEQLGFTGYCDFSSIKWDEKRVSVAFVDNALTAELEAVLTQRVELQSDISVELKPIRLMGGISHKIDANLATLAQNGIGAIWLHEIPFKLERSLAFAGTGQSVVNPFKNQPVYTNSTSKPVSVSVDMIVAGRGKCSTATNLELVGKSNEVVLFRSNPVSMATNYTDFSLPVSFAAVIEPSKSLTLSLLNLQAVDSYTIHYDSALSYLTIEEVREQKPSRARGCGLKYGLAETLKTVNQSVDFGQFRDLFFTNGLNIRGRESKVSVSFEELFRAANCSQNLAADWFDDRLWIGHKFELLAKYGVVDLGVVDECEVSMNSEWFFAKAKVGYKTWQAESVNGNQEVNSTREYEFERKIFGNELNLLSDFIASRYVIEETRNKQFETAKVADWKFDYSLFWLPDARYSMSPEEMLFAWCEFIKLAGKYSITSFTGSVGSQYYCSGKSVWGLRKFRLKKLMSIVEFKAVGLGKVRFEWCGELVQALVYDSSFYVKPNEESEAEFWCWELHS